MSKKYNTTEIKKNENTATPCGFENNEMIAMINEISKKLLFFFLIPFIKNLKTKENINKKYTSASFQKHQTQLPI